MKIKSLHLLKNKLHSKYRNPPTLPAELAFFVPNSPNIPNWGIVLLITQNNPKECQKYYFFSSSAFSSAKQWTIPGKKVLLTKAHKTLLSCWCKGNGWYFWPGLGGDFSIHHHLSIPKRPPHTRTPWGAAIKSSWYKCAKCSMQQKLWQKGTLPSAFLKANLCPVRLGMRLTLVPSFSTSWFSGILRKPQLQKQRSKVGMKRS